MSKLLPLVVCLTVLGVISCTQREVIGTKQSSYSFGQQWAGQTGDVDKMESKFASGFEIKDGRAVSAGNSKEPFAKEEFAFKNLDKKGYRDGGKDSNLKKPLFGGDKKFKVKNFDSGNPARESGSVSPYATADANLDKQFKTKEYGQRDKSFNTPDAREGDKLFGFAGGDRDAAMGTDAPRAQAKQTMDQEGNTMDMTVDEVRRLLNPGEE